MARFLSEILAEIDVNLTTSGITTATLGWRLLFSALSQKIF